VPNPEFDERGNLRRLRRLALIAGLASGLLAPGAVAQDEDEDGAASEGEESPAVTLPGVRPPRVTQPRAGDEDAVPPTPQPGADEIVLPAMSEPMELKALLTYLVETMNINLNIDPNLSGSVVLNAPMVIKRDDLLTVVNTLLEQHSYTLTHDSLTGFYQVVPLDKVGIGFEGVLATTRIIDTPNVKPSSLSNLISIQFGGQPPANPPGLQISYVDDLGFIIATGSARKVAAVADLVDRILQHRAQQERVAIDLKYISASAAKKRLMEMAGADQQPNLGGGEMNQGGLNIPKLDNLEDRLIVSPQGNTIIFRGLPEEVEEIRALLAEVDRPNLLDAVRYFAGTATTQIADLATSRGFGESAKFDPNNPQFTVRPDGSLAPQEQITGGSVIVVDEARGYLVYYGTPEQQAEMDELVKQFKPENEVPVLRVYKLSNGDAEKVAEVIQGLLQNQAPTGTGALLTTGTTQQPAMTDEGEIIMPEGEQTGAEGQETFQGGEGVFVIADIANNQIIVKAPLKQQGEFANLIKKLDLRRPQVFVKAQIVAVTASDRFRLAFETQLINANGEGGVVNTNFGLTNVPAGGGNILDPKVVGLGLSGITGAVILNDYVPIVINALQRDVDARVVATPQLLVDDNEEASITSIEIQPTQVVSQGGDTTVTGTGEPAEAGTTLTITPHISDGYIHAEIEITLSNFIGEPTSDGLPPPSQERTLTAGSVTIPNGMTIVVGGLTFENISDTILKVPLLGDIPLIKYLFRDTSKNSDRTTLYVFLTPQIMRDPNFVDLALISKGPQAAAEINPDIPELHPQIIDTFGTLGDSGSAAVPPDAGN
jgi:type II secretory pathway component GspD/PulD (secretin)